VGMMEEFFFYYEEIIYKKKPRKAKEHLSHVMDESEEFVSSTSGIARPRIIEEHKAGETIYYIELIGVSDKRNITLELEGDVLRIKAKLDKTLVYPGLTGSTRVREYSAEIVFPYKPEPTDIRVSFDSSRSLLVVRLRKKTKRVSISIE